MSNSLIYFKWTLIEKEKKWGQKIFEEITDNIPNLDENLFLLIDTRLANPKQNKYKENYTKAHHSQTENTQR